MSQVPSIRVLLVEDDEDVRVSTSQALSLAGFEVEAFASAERARAHVSFGAPVVLVCDVRLPGRSGTDWLPEIRTIDAELPVILFTGHGHIAMVQAIGRRHSRLGAGGVHGQANTQVPEPSTVWLALNAQGNCDAASSSTIKEASQPFSQRGDHGVVSGSVCG